MKLYRYIDAQERNLLLNGKLNRNVVNVCQLSSFFFKNIDVFGKFFFLFKDDAIKFATENFKSDEDDFNLLIRIAKREREFKDLESLTKRKEALNKRKYSILEIDVPKNTILKNIGIGLYDSDNLKNKYELRTEILLPFQRAKISIQSSYKLYDYEGKDLTNIIGEIYKKDFTNPLVSEPQKDFNVVDNFELENGIKTFKFKNNDSKTNSSSIMKKLDKLEKTKQ